MCHFRIGSGGWGVEGLGDGGHIALNAFGFDARFHRLVVLV